MTENGVKTFSFVGRAKGSSRVERLTFGKFPTVKPEEARNRAYAMVELLDWPEGFCRGDIGWRAL